MAGPIFKNLVRDQSTTGGTGTLTLAGAATGFQAASVIGDGNAAMFVIREVDGSGLVTGAWEVNSCTYSASAGTLVRSSTPEDSSNGGALVNFTASTNKIIELVHSASQIALAAPSSVAFDIETTGADNTTVFKDSGPYGFTVTTAGTTKITSNRAVFTSNGDTLSIATKGQVPFGAKDFSISFKFKTSATLVYSTMAYRGGIGGDGTAGEIYLLINSTTNDGKVQVFIQTFGNPLITSSVGGFNNGVEHTFLLTRVGSLFTLYVDGTSVGTATNGNPIQDTSAPWTLGASVIYPTTRSFVGTLGAFQVSSGQAATAPAVAVPAMVLLETHTASNSATLDFTSCISSTYDEYEIHFNNIIPATSGAQLNMRVSSNGGTSYDATAGNYTWEYAAAAYNAVGNNGSISDTSIGIAGQNSATGLSLTGRMVLHNPLSTTLYKLIEGVFNSTDPSRTTATLGGLLAGKYVVAGNAVNALRFFFSSGNIASGTIRVYGISNAVQVPSGTAFANTTESTVSARPLLPNVGDVNFATDEPMIARYDGANWSNYGPAYRLYTPPLTGWTVYGSGTDTTTFGPADILTTIPGGASGARSQGYTRAVPTAPYTITMAFVCPMPLFNYYGAQLVLSNGTGLKILQLNWPTISATAAESFTVRRMTNPTTFSADATIANNFSCFATPNTPVWMQINDDGTNINYRISFDGQRFLTLLTEARTTFITPTLVGFGVAYENSGPWPAAMRVLSWRQQ